MPFTTRDVAKHTQKANTSKLKRQWVEVANAALADCEGEDDCEAAAIRQANGVIAKAVAESEEDVEEATKTVDGQSYPAGDFLVVEDPDSPSTWHLQVKKNGKADHRLMAAARAALTSPGGHRGNKYAGPDKAGATSKLKALYKSEDMEWGEADATVKTIKGQAISLGNGFMLVRVEAEPEIEEAEVGGWEAVELTYLPLETEPAAEPEAEEEPPAEEVAELAEAEVGQALTLTDIAETDVTALGISEADLGTERRAPVLIDFQIIQPGPGNKKDKHYYPRPVLERDAGVFDGVDVFVTDHKETERSERTKVGRVRKAPSRFTETGAPVGQVILYDPDMAEKARNRADAGELATLECSIYARGQTKPGKVDGTEYKVVEAITEGLYLELVSKAGAGGKALALAESNTGGNHMPEDQETQDEVQEVEDLHEDAAPALLAETDVTRLLGESHLPQASRDRLAKGEWADEAALNEAITAEVEYVKSVSGSGQPFEQGGNQPTAVQETAQERERRRAQQFNAIMAEVGISARTPVPEEA